MSVEDRIKLLADELEKVTWNYQGAHASTAMVNMFSQEVNRLFKGYLKDADPTTRRSLVCTCDRYSGNIQTSVEPPLSCYSDRYVIYARSQRRSPEDQQLWDRETGGPIPPFFGWLSEKRQELEDELGPHCSQADFTRFLERSVKDV